MLILPPHLHKLAISAKKMAFFQFILLITYLHFLNLHIHTTPYLVMPFWPIHHYVGSYPYLTNTRKIAETTLTVPGKGGHPCILSTVGSCLPVNLHIHTSPYLVMPFWPIHHYVGSYPYLTNTRRIAERTQSVPGKGGHLCILSTVGSCLPVRKFLCLCHLILQRVLT